MPPRAELPNYLKEGFVVPYAADQALRFHAAAGTSAISAALFFYFGRDVFLVFAVVLACVAYYFYPLAERKPRLGANQYGVFIDGFGLVAWRSIGDITLATIAVRTIETSELHIKLNDPLFKSLVVDWRNLPVWRLLMRLPWVMTHDNIIRVNLQPFEAPPEEVQRIVARMWKFYRS